MDGKKILRALEERDRWESRRRELLDLIRKLPVRERRARREDLHWINQQITYYEGLTRAIKRDVHPTKLGDFLNSV